MSNVTVITRKQLEAIRAKAGLMASQVMLLCKQACMAQFFPLSMQIQETEHTLQQQDRLHLKKLSDQRAARWPDTLQARVPSTWLNAAAHAAMHQPVSSRYCLPGLAAVPCVLVYRVMAHLLT